MTERYDEEKTKNEIGRVRHGSPVFYALLQEMAETHDKKSHDYASDSDPFGNYHFAGKLAQLFTHSYEDAGFVGRLGEKIYRLANLERDNKTPLNESIADTERDIAIIVALWMSDRRDRRAKKLENIRKIKEKIDRGEWTGIESNQTKFPEHRHGID